MEDSDGNGAGIEPTTTRSQSNCDNRRTTVAAPRPGIKRSLNIQKEKCSVSQT